MKEIKYSTNTTITTDKFHLINCEIEHNGEANVSTYFEPAIVKKDDNLDVSFRGRPMHGKTIKLPSDYILTNLKLSNKNEDLLQTNLVSNEFTYWNFDQKPDPDDATNQAINWLNINKQLNGIVTIDDLKKFDE